MILTKKPDLLGNGRDVQSWIAAEKSYYLYRLISFVQRQIEHISVVFEEY
jgi:hypothetical protein